MPLGKYLGLFSFEFDVRSSLSKCAIGVSLLKYSSELATKLFPLYFVDDVVGVGITHAIWGAMSFECRLLEFLLFLGLLE